MVDTELGLAPDFERTVKPSFPRRRESTPWPHIYGGITVTWYNKARRFAPIHDIILFYTNTNSL